MRYTVGIGAKKSTPYTVVTQCTQQVLVQKGQTSVCSTQYPVVYGGEDIVFGAKRSNQRRQLTQYTVAYWYMVVGTLSLVQKGQTRGYSGYSMQWNSGIWWWGHCLWCKKVKPVDSVDAVTQWTQYTV